jgi:hypothetical protein
MKTFNSFMKDKSGMVSAKSWSSLQAAMDAPITTAGTATPKVLKPVDRVTASKHRAPEEKMKVLVKGKKAINEASKKKLTNYSANAYSDYLDARDSGDTKRETKRVKGMANADRKLGHQGAKARVPAKGRKPKISIGECEETINEVSAGLLGRYIAKARTDRQKKQSKHPKSEAGQIKLARQVGNRAAGTERAVDKLTGRSVMGSKGRAKVLAKEETLFELSRNTLKKYIKKASDSRSDAQYSASEYQYNPEGKGNSWSKYGKDLRTVTKRRNGIRKAVDKL